MIARRHNTRFSLMVAGSCGSGKSTLLNSLVDREIVNIDPSTEINIYLLNLESDGNMQKITFIDTPGFGNSMNDEALQDSIVDYIKDQFDSYIEEETKIRRNAKYEDTRVHCLVYLIPATGNGLKQRDVEFLKKVSGLVNVIPILSKTEGMASKELQDAKTLVREQLSFYKIKVFDFENESIVLPAVIEQRLNSAIPFACVFPEETGEQPRIRTHQNAVVEVDNPAQCEYSKLRDALLSTHIEALIETTDSDLYEKYRSDALENILQD